MAKEGAARPGGDRKFAWITDKVVNEVTSCDESLTGSYRLGGKKQSDTVQSIVAMHIESCRAEYVPGSHVFVFAVHPEQQVFSGHSERRLVAEESDLPMYLRHRPGAVLVHETSLQ